MRLFEGGGRWRGEVRFPREDGRVFYLLVSFSVGIFFLPFSDMMMMVVVLVLGIS